MIVPLRYQLRNGDTVEILTSPNQKPNKDWLKFVVTSRARTKIRHFIREEQRERSRQLGPRPARARAAQARLVAGDAPSSEGGSRRGASELRVGTVDDLMVAGRLRQDHLAHAADAMLIDQSRAAAGADGPRPPPATRPAPLARRVAKRSIAGIRVQGEADILVKFAKCCTPVPGDDIVGFISRGRGVVIHTRDCPKALDLDPARRVDVAWDDGVEDAAAGRGPGDLHRPAGPAGGHLEDASPSTASTSPRPSAGPPRTAARVNTFQVTVGHLDQLKTRAPEPDIA